MQYPAGIVRSREGENVTYRKTVGDANKGDAIVHYVGPYVVAFSLAKEKGRGPLHIPEYGSGWQFRTEYVKLAVPVHKDLFATDLVALRKKHYPIDKNGNVRQGYFFPFDLAGLECVLKHVNEKIAWLDRLV